MDLPFGQPDRFILSLYIWHKVIHYFHSALEVYMFLFFCRWKYTLHGPKFSTFNILSNIFVEFFKWKFHFVTAYFHQIHITTRTRPMSVSLSDLCQHTETLTWIIIQWRHYYGPYVIYTFHHYSKQNRSTVNIVLRWKSKNFVKMYFNNAWKMYPLLHKQTAAVCHL